MNEVIRVLNSHRSIRKYKSTDIPDDILDVIISAVQGMPNSINGQQTSLVVVRDADKKKKLAELVGNQAQVESCPVFIIFVMDFYKTYLAGEKNGNKQIIHESLEGITAGNFDAGIQFGAAVIAAESLGLGICPIGGIRRNPKEVIDILELPEYTFPLVGLTLGYPDESPKKKPRMPMKAYRHEEAYHKESLEPAIDEYDDEMSNYLEEIGRKDKEINWSTQTSKSYKVVYFPKVKGALEEQGFKMDK